MDDDETKPVEQRNSRGQFVAGNKANASGNNGSTLVRRVHVPDGAEIETAIRMNAPLVVEALLKIAVDSKQPAGARVNAAKTLLERAFGKPAIVVSSPQSETFEGFDIEQLSPEAVAEIVRIADATKGDD